MPAASAPASTRPSSNGCGGGCNRWPFRDAARRAAAALDPLRFAAGFVAGALGAAELVAEVKFLTWTEDNLLRQVVYEGLREDKPAAEVRREVPHPKQRRPRKNSQARRRDALAALGDCNGWV